MWCFACKLVILVRAFLESAAPREAATYVIHNCCMYVYIYTHNIEQTYLSKMKTMRGVSFIA